MHTKISSYGIGNRNTSASHGSSISFPKIRKMIADILIATVGICVSEACSKRSQIL